MLVFMFIKKQKLNIYLPTMVESTKEYVVWSELDESQVRQRELLLPGKIIKYLEINGKTRFSKIVRYNNTPGVIVISTKRGNKKILVRIDRIISVQK